MKTNVMLYHDSLRIPLAFLIPLFIALLALSSCQEETKTISTPDNDRPVITKISQSGCKQFPGAAALGVFGPDQSCISYEFADEVLHIRHINAGFNCCPGEISADISVEEGVITITEREEMAGCHCLCLFDITYRVENLDAGQYTINVIELYTETGDEPLEFTIDLVTEPTGVYCVPRNHYPWESGPAGNDPWGRVVDFTGCKEATGTLQADETPFDLDCVEYQYIGDGILLIAHVNAGFNCCTEEVTAEITVENDTITIVEGEIGAPCDCICLFDVNYEIQNLTPGRYVIKIVGLYLQPEDDPLQFVADLTAYPVGWYCVERYHYPWGSVGSQEDDWERLAQMKEKIIEYIGVPACSGVSDCRCVGLGAKPCGGPWEYLIYSTATVDERILRLKVTAYNTYNDILNRRYGIYSDCMVVPPPEIGCDAGRCVDLGVHEVDRNR